MRPIYAIVLLVVLMVQGCSKSDDPRIDPLVVLKTGDYTTPGQEVPVGGKLAFGITASGGSAPITNLIVRRIVNGISITELDRGMFIEKGGLDFTMNAVKSSASEELWQFVVLNANRDSAVSEMTVLLGEGSAYSAIKHFPSVKIGMQQNNEFPQYLDLHTGICFTSDELTGFESQIDLVGFVYMTGGVMSPTLCCPAYTGSSSVTTHYPLISNWEIRNSTLYDYNASDNNLVDPLQFEIAQNDSLLVASYDPQSVSGLCKYIYSDRIVPFKTTDGKYGLIRVVHSDTETTGYMELDIKIQE
jgi:hypothetical protein